jgi:hypothetical protein
MMEAIGSSKALVVKATSGRTSNLSRQDQVTLTMKLKILSFRSLMYIQGEHSQLTHFRAHFCSTMGGTGQSLHIEEDII